MKQEVKIVNTETKEAVFFFGHSFKSAHYYAKEYAERNNGKFPMKAYILSGKRAPHPKWVLWFNNDNQNQTGVNNHG